MPKIPIYDQPQIQQQGFNPAMQHQTKSNAAEVLGMVGQGAQIFLQEKEKADAYRAEDAYNKLQERKIQLWGEAQQRQGENAFNVHDDFVKRFDEDAEKLATGMGGGAAEKFRQIAARGRLAFSSQLEQHQAGQIDAFKHKTALSGISLALDETSKNFGTPIAEQAINRAQYLAGMEADRQGLKGDAYTNMVMGVSSKAHLANIQAWMKKDPAAASAYRDQVKDWMTADDLDKIEDPLKARVAESQAVQMVDQIEASLPTATQAERDKHARDTIKDADQLKLVRGELDRRAALRRDEVNEQQGALVAMYVGLDGKRSSRQEVKEHPLYLGMSKKDRLEVDRAMKQEDDRADNGESGGSMTDFITYLNLAEKPEVLMGMTDAGIVKLGLGNALTKKLLLDKHGAEGKIAKNANVSIPKADFDAIWFEHGMPVPVAGESEKTKQEKLAQKAKLRAALTDRMIEKQAELKRQLNDEERDELQRGLLRKVKLSKGKESPLFQVQDSGEIEATRSERVAVLAAMVDANMDLNDPVDFSKVLGILRKRAK